MVAIGIAAAEKSTGLARTLFKMRLSNIPYHPEYEDLKDEWDILWTDGTVDVQKLYRMKPY